MTDSRTLVLAQLNPTVGDIVGNVARLLDARGQVKDADIVVASELYVSGYPPEDLVLRADFLDAVKAGVERLAAATSDGGPALIVGAPWREEGMRYNSALLLDQGKIAAVRHKVELPNYGVFDEKRVFSPSHPSGPVVCRGVRLGLGVCEDMWTPEVAKTFAESGTEIMILLNGSPYERDKRDQRLGHAVARVREASLPLVYVNQLGGQDELVFDGESFVLNADGRLAAQAPSFRAAVLATRWQKHGEAWVCAEGERHAPAEGLAAIYQAMMLGLADYVAKNDFPGVVIGLSGGVDSALTAVVAADALGGEKVHGLLLPSPYTARMSIEDALAVATTVGARHDTLPIPPAMAAFDLMLERGFGEKPKGVTHENLQARIRAVALMAVSNSTGELLLTTGNKSEMSVGYATLYGDMCGGFSVIKDLYKTDVYALARWRNENRPEGARGPGGVVIPDRVLTRAPTAELRPNQKDEDSLPPYAKLDPILQGLIEEDLGVEALAGRGHDRDTVARIARMLAGAEYKRRQAPPGVKLTGRAFGRDRRYPLTNAFRDGAKDSPKRG
ncbi:MAG: NAD+ synthase [Alphaproteobacteria bacterium]|nr:NAD+ synthase [Alphaproteobacteria bacterium]